jgi:hypothetical protein
MYCRVGMWCHPTWLYRSSRTAGYRTELGGLPLTTQGSRSFARKAVIQESIESDPIDIFAQEGKFEEGLSRVRMLKVLSSTSHITPSALLNNESLIIS